MYSENYYQRKFFDFTSTHTFFNKSTFIREVPLFYDSLKRKKSKDKYMPDLQPDFIELDKKDKFHLWEAKMLHSEDLIKGKVIGQLIFYDFLFSTYEKNDFIEVLTNKGFPKKRLKKTKKQKFNFKTWNILVCGGEGWELAAGVNPIMWNYNAGLDPYIKNPKHINVWHFFKTSKGFVLKSLWELSVLAPTYMDFESYQKYLQNIGESKCEIPENVRKNAEKPYIYQKEKNALNKFIGRDWFQ